MVEIECPNCKFKNEVPEEFKVFNVVMCPKCFTQINLPWCRKGFEAKEEPMVIMNRETFEEIFDFDKKEKEVICDFTEKKKMIDGIIAFYCELSNSECPYPDQSSCPSYIEKKIVEGNNDTS